MSTKIINNFRGERGLIVRSASDGLPDLSSSSLVNLGASNSIFGSMGQGRFPFNTTMDFVPYNGQGGVVDLHGTNIDPKWLGLENTVMQYWAYNYCSPLAAVIDRLAEADTNGELQYVNEDYTLNESWRKNPTFNRVMNLLLNPNPLQTWEEFNAEQVVMCKIYGYCPVFCVTPAGMDASYAKYMFNLNPYYARPTFNRDFEIYGNSTRSIQEVIEGVDREQIIKSWHMSLFGRSYTIDAKHVLLIKDGFIDSSLQNMGLPISKIAGLDFCVSNICAAMEADNVLLKKKGPLGVFSHDPRPDIAGWQPLSNDVKLELQNDLKQYGMTLGQLQYIVSKTPIKWNSMSFNAQELMTKETVRQGIDGICDRFGFPAELMSGKNATYENRNSAEKYMYQNNIIPFSLRRMIKYCKYFGVKGLQLNYDHLPVLQEDIVKAATARYASSQALTLDWVNGMITWNEYRVALKMKPVAGFDLYYPEYTKKYPLEVKMTKDAAA